MTKFIKVTDTHYGHSNNTHKIHEKFLNLMAHEIQKQKIDAVIHSGDWISHNQHQLPRTWKMFRRILNDIPILAVRGNHDLWNYDQFQKGAAGRYAKPYFSNINELYNAHSDWASDCNITLLEVSPVVIKDCVVFGFDGWYGQRGTTNDPDYMHRIVESGAPIDQWLSYRAYKDMQQSIDWANSPEYQDKKKVLVTHMPPGDMRLGSNMRIDMAASPSIMPFITETFDVCCFGHTHFPLDIEIDGCRFINAGTDYEKNHGYNYPLYKIFEV